MSSASRLHIPSLFAHLLSNSGVGDPKIVPAITINNLLHHWLYEPKCTLNFRGGQVMLPGVVDGLEEHRVGVRLVAVLSPHPPVHSRGQDPPHVQVEWVQVRRARRLLGLCDGDPRPAALALSLDCRPRAGLS